MENFIINQVLNNFDFTYMLIINVLTYIVIKIIDEINKEKIVTETQKRIVLLVSIIIVTLLYILFGYSNKLILINSAILSPVFWSWILKPIIKKLNIDYKHKKL